MSARERELADRLAQVRERIRTSAARAGRDPEAVTLVVVTKYFPASDVAILAGLGVTDVGENRHQEAMDKREVCADLGLRWHFIGGLQSNKAAAVAHWADVVQSVDRAKLFAPLARGAAEAGRVLDVALQVSLDAPDATTRAGGARAGAEPEVLGALADAVEEYDELRLRGLMAVAPRDGDPRAAFARLADVAADLRATHPDADWVSAGMSGDLEAAIEFGATHVRVGSAVLGSRPVVH